MKIISVILAVIIVTLSAIPCDDGAIIEGDAIASLQQDTSEADFDSNHSEEHNKVDLCSPFSTCVCCASIVLKPSIAYTDVASDIPSNRLITSYDAMFSNNYLSKIFQPPQV